MDMGTVRANTDRSTGEMDAIITSEPTTVTALAPICKRSWERDVFTVSIS